MVLWGLSKKLWEFLFFVVGFLLGWFVGNKFVPNSDGFLVWSTVLTAVSTFMLVVVTAKLWNVTERAALAADESAKMAARAAEISEKAAQNATDTAQRQLRAYVQVEGAQLMYGADGRHLDKISAGSLVVAKVSIRNTGQTPARDVQIRSVIALRPAPLESSMLKLGNKKVVESRTTLGSGLGCSSRASSPGFLDFSTVEDVRSGKQVICLFGEITYADVFGCTHKTSFRLVNAKGLDDGTMAFTEEGNEAD